MPSCFFILAGLLGTVSLLPAQESRSIDSARDGLPKPVLAKAGPGERAKREQVLREFLQKLPPEKRQQVLAALKNVWDDQSVKAAREQLKTAADTYKRTMRQAIDGTDPQVRETVRPLLERLLKDGLNPAQRGAGADGPPRLQRLFGLGTEKLESLSPEERRLIASVRDRVAADDRVTAALARVEQTPDQTGGRVPALRELRRTARAVAVELEPRLAPLLDRLAEPMPESGTK